MTKIVDFTKGKEVWENEIIRERKTVDNWKTVKIREIVEKPVEEITLQDKQIAVKEKIIELQYKLITDWLDDAETTMLWLLVN